MTSALDDLAAAHLGDAPGDVRAACPLCAKKKNDDAVNITVNDDGSVVAHCHRCHENGTARGVNGRTRPEPKARSDAGVDAKSAVSNDATPEKSSFTALWNSAVDPGEAFEHPYLTNKQVQPYSIRVKGDRLLVAARNISGNLTGVETIAPDGKKRWVKGSTKVASFHLIGMPSGTICIAEGYATAATIYAATGHAVAVAFDAGNLTPVAAALRKRFAANDLIVCADDDRATEGNPGITSATVAARAVNARLALPRWPSDVDRGNGTDFIDLRTQCGDDVVRECIDQARSLDDDALKYDLASDLDDNGDEADELVERLLTRGAMGVIYGDSNSGKTFLAIDIASAVARGVAWMERNVERGMVIYLASESPASVRRRVRAYQRHHGLKVPHLPIVRSPVDLYNGEADTQRVVDLVRKLEARLGVKCELVIGDTLSRLSAGANENSGEDMSIVVRHVDRIRHECRVHFLLVHHTGKDAARGMRGWSGMRAAIDTEIEVTTDDSGAHAAEITKQRDIAGKGDRIGFRLDVVDMGVGKWRKPITSCVVSSALAPAKPTGKRPSEIAGAITEFLVARGSGIKKRELVDHFDGRYTDSAVYREIKKMALAGALREVVGVVALVRS